MITWSEVIARVRPGDRLTPLNGSSHIEVESVGGDHICLTQRLWRACLTRHDVETACRLLAESPHGTTAMQLAEHVRRYEMSGRHGPVSECSRVPNLTAVLLHNLGYVDAAR